MLGIFAIGVLGLLSWGVYYDITVLQPAWEAQQKIEREKEKAALEQQEKSEEAQKLQEEVEWAHCVGSKGSDSICKKVCVRYYYKPGFAVFQLATLGIDCRRFGIVSEDDQRYLEGGLCVGSKGSDPICKKVCINHGQHGELTPLGIDCTKFGVAVDNRLPFEIKEEKDEQNFGQAVALCAYGDKAACEYRRGDPWPP
jgi:hypothetical protein